MRSLLLTAGLLVACGGAPPPSAEAPAGPDSSPTAEAELDEGTAPADDIPSEEEIDAAEAELGEGDGEAEEEEEDPNRQREVVYKMTGDGLVVQVEGLDMLVTGEAVRRGGGWAARVKVEARAIDDNDHSLLAPENGPLAFFAEVATKGKIDSKKVGDERKGSDDMTVTAGDSLEFHRDFPAEGKPGLFIGQSLKLQTGLWGLGKVGKRRRPVRKLAMVQMVVVPGKPKVHINPPD